MRHFVGFVLITTLGLSGAACSKSASGSASAAASSSSTEVPTLRLVPSEVDLLVLKPKNKPESRLERTAAGWTIGGASAKQDLVDKLLTDLQGASVADQIGGSESYEMYGVTPAEAIHVVATSKGKSVLDIYIGKSGTRGQPIRIASDQRVFSAKGLSTYLYDQGPDAFRAPDPAKAAEACKSGDLNGCDVACTAGNNEACLTLGQLRLKSNDDTIKASAVAPLKKACDGGLGRACSEVGGPALFAIRTKEIGALKLMKDKAKQLEIKEEQVRLATKGCDLNDGLGCATLAGWYAEGYGVPKDASKANELAKKAVTLFEKECEAGDASSCAGLGYLYVGGKNGIAKDKSKALKFFKKGCDAKDEQACNGLKELG